MSATDLVKAASRCEPLLGGRTVMGLLGGVLLFGRTWCGGAGTALYRGATRAAIDTTTPIGACGIEAGSIAVRAGVVLAEGTHYMQAIPFGPGGVNAVAPTTGIVAVEIVGGSALSARPGSPRGIRVVALSGGRLAVRWTFVAAAGRVRPAQFRVYSDASSAEIDMVTPLGVVAARISGDAEGDYCWTSEAFAHGKIVQFRVRAATAGGIEDENAIVRRGAADAEPPTVGVISAVTIGGDE